jgi:tetratricopeptide (TPR) repeat protein
MSNRAEEMPEDLTDIALDGHGLSPEQAAEIETRLANDPTLIRERVLLLGHYARRQFDSESARAAKAVHVLWMIENLPREEITGSPFCCVYAEEEPETAAEAQTRWRRQLAGHPDDTCVLRNAARFFSRLEPEYAETLLLRATQLEPSEADWHDRLARHYTSRARDTAKAEDRQRFSAKAFETQLRALELSPDRLSQFYYLTNLPELAIEANDLTTAAARANELLERSKEFPADWNFGNATHKAHSALGRVALAADDVANAKAHLLAAGRIHGSPQLNSFGPSMVLARDLLDAGERDVVIEYFELCRRFWRMDYNRLTVWTTAVRNGEQPDFGANLFR